MLVENAVNYHDGTVAAPTSSYEPLASEAKATKSRDPTPACFRED